MAVCIVKSWGRKCWELQGRQRWRETQRERGAEGGRREVGWIKAGSKNHMERQTGSGGVQRGRGGRMVGWWDGSMVGWYRGQESNRDPSKSPTALNYKDASGS